jgi:hypothetical protein
MDAQSFTIDAKHRQIPAYLSSLADFSVTPGDLISPDVVRTNPDVSLYCLDDVGKQAIFVELPSGVNLAAVPFVYQTLYEQAQRLISVPYPTFRQLAYDLPDVEHLIMIYMTGRSGSTLLSHIFNELDDVLSLSEADVATQFAHLRSADGSRDAELCELLECTVRFLAKPTVTKTPSAFVLKVRSEGTQAMDLYQTAFPHAKNLFLYRDAIGWVASFSRIFQLAGMPASMPLDAFVALWGQLNHYDFAELAACLGEGVMEISSVQQLTLWWLATMEWYLTKYEQGLPILAVGYDTLNSDREQTLTGIFNYCGLPTTQVKRALSVFDKDAQAGTFLARENPREGNQLALSDEQIREITSILGRHPLIKQPDFTPPGTLQI